MTSSSSASKTPDTAGEKTGRDEGERSQYLTFVLDGETYAFAIDTVREVVEVPPITRIPQVADHMRGVINLRGTAVPVMDLRRKFGMSEGEVTVDSCIIIVTVGQNEDREDMGALVDSVCEVVEIPQARVEPPPRMGATIHNQFMRGMVESGRDFFILLDIERVFDQEGPEPTDIPSADFPSEK